jgi:hypothetical protein
MPFENIDGDEVYDSGHSDIFRLFLSTRAPQTRTGVFVGDPPPEDPAPPGSGVANLEDPLGRYHVAFTGNDGTNNRIRYQRSVGPTPPFLAVDQWVTASNDDREPALGWDPRNGRLLLLFSRVELFLGVPISQDVYEIYSDDDGATWSTPVLRFSSATRPQVATSPNGTILRTARTASGQLRGRLQYPGDAAPRAFHTLKDAALQILVVEDDCYGLGWLKEGAGRAILHVRLSCFPLVPVVLVSGDDSNTWDIVQSFITARYDLPDVTYPTGRWEDTPLDELLTIEPGDGFSIGFDDDPGQGYGRLKIIELPPEP